MENKTISLTALAIGDDEIKKIFDTKFLTEDKTTKEFEVQVTSYLDVHKK